MQSNAWYAAGNDTLPSTGTTFTVTLQQATPAIEQFLLNERKRDIIAKDLKAMRDAAKIEYVGKYAEAAASAPAGGATPVAAPAAPAAPAPAASTALDASSISKGMGLK